MMTDECVGRTRQGGWRGRRERREMQDPPILNYWVRKIAKIEETPV